MKKIFFVLALAVIGLSTSTQVKAQSTFQKEQTPVFNGKITTPP